MFLIALVVKNNMIDYIICEDSGFVDWKLDVGGQDIWFKIATLERLLTRCALFYSHEWINRTVAFWQDFVGVFSPLLCNNFDFLRLTFGNKDINFQSNLFTEFNWSNCVISTSFDWHDFSPIFNPRNKTKVLFCFYFLQNHFKQKYNKNKL